MLPLFRTCTHTKSRRRKATKRSLHIEQLESRYALSAVSVLNLDPNVSYYNTDSMQITPSGETGIRGTGTSDQYYITGNSGADGLLFVGTIAGVGTSYVVDYIDGSANQYITNVYGPDAINATTVRLVGTYKDASSSSDQVDGFLFEGTTADFTNPANYRTISIPGATYTYAHSTAGGLVVGNYDNPADHGMGNLQYGPSHAFIYSIAQNQQIAEVAFPGAKSTCAYGIWYNGGTSYTICGGYSLGFANNFLNQGQPLGASYLVDYDSATGEFSHWTSYVPPAGFNTLTHFQGISGVESGTYTIAAVTLPGITTQPVQGFLVTVDRNADGSFGANVWTALDDPAGTATSANSVYGNQIVGVVGGAATPGYQATVFAVDVVLLAYLASLQQDETEGSTVPGRSAPVQALGQNALPATDIPGVWQAGGVYAVATPWKLAVSVLAPLGGVLRTDSLEVGALGNLAQLARSGHGFLADDLPSDTNNPDAKPKASMIEELPSPEEKRAAEKDLRG